MKDRYGEGASPHKGYDTDLACERRRADLNTGGIIYRRESVGAFTWERIEITSREGEEEIGRPMGRYDTLSTDRMDLLDEEDINDASNEIAKELCSADMEMDAEKTACLSILLESYVKWSNAISAFIDASDRLFARKCKGFRVSDALSLSTVLRNATEKMKGDLQNEKLYPRA